MARTGSASLPPPFSFAISSSTVSFSGKRVPHVEPVALAPSVLSACVMRLNARWLLWSFFMAASFFLSRRMLFSSSFRAYLGEVDLEVVGWPWLLLVLLDARKELLVVDEDVLETQRLLDPELGAHDPLPHLLEHAVGVDHERQVRAAET